MFSVIFDMDGTLLDTQKICIPAWDWAGERQGIKNVGECIPDVLGTNLAGWSKYLRKKYPTMDVDLFNAEFLEYVAKHLVVKYRPGAEILLKFLKEKGIKLALATGSSKETIEHHLKAVGATDVFDVIVPGTAVANGKPAPDIFLLAAQKLGVNPEDCYVLEDSPKGIIAGYNAGMKCIGIPDVVKFDAETKALITAEFSDMSKAIPFFEGLL